MSTTPPPYPHHPPPPPPAQPRISFLGCAFALSFLGNMLSGLLILLLCLGFFLLPGDADSSSRVPEKYYSGSRSATDKVAVVSIEGVLLEGLLTHFNKQLEQAGQDDNVKAVVLRINSPGGSITASDDIHRAILRLRDGDADRNVTAKPIVVSMASVAASGGYFIAVPARQIFAEPTTITGSIGVYTSLPNLKGVADKVGFAMTTIKAGEIKDAGSLFDDLSPKERQVYQDMVDDAYVQFLTVVEKGRPKLTRATMLQRFEVRPLRPDPAAQKDVKALPYERYRADGGVFTAERAGQLGLIDAVGNLDDAVKAAAGAAGLNTYRAVRYERTRSLTDLLLGVRTPNPPRGSIDPAQLRAALSPRLWYLAPGYEAAGLLAASE